VHIGKDDVSSYLGSLDSQAINDGDDRECVQKNMPF
jgi:hypothetical protein